MPPARKERADAARNREAVLTAAARLFTERGDPDRVSMDDIAAAAGVGKGTLFRRFGDRVGLVKALVEQRTEQLRADVVAGPPPLGPGTPAGERVLALLDALLSLKLETRPLMLALESAGSGSPYLNDAYALWHAQLASLLAEVRGERDADYLAHALLAAVRSDLIEHLATSGTSPQHIHDGVDALARAVLAAPAPGGA
ncbi:TetR family transcriptional regulator [Streptomyces lunaelactis]|uniref:TetR family transcriptional regulator n=1 Tax=Streptomyces lunaelactis TaxID=1535768 RepID=A0A2R4T2H2_9ACTN|nr:TetR/AcrR family transcriptional regulator [Streptomyces lunaelactis]AVZ73257.1 TetR family transcriptional regulator [Streptomyces lunaelactis]